MFQTKKLALALLLVGFLGAQSVEAQVRALPVNSAARAGLGAWGWGGGFGWGGGWGWRGGWGGYNPYNPYNPYSWVSPFNPYSPVSPYNAYSYNNPFNNPAVAFQYNYNPYAYLGLYSWNPYVRAGTLANINAVGIYDYTWYANYAMMYNYNASLMYNTALYNNLATSNYATMASVYNAQQTYNTLMQAQYNSLLSQQMNSLALNNAYMSMALQRNQNPYALGGGGFSSPYAPNRPQQIFGGGGNQNPFPGGPPPGGGGPQGPQGPPPPGFDMGKRPEMFVKLNQGVPDFNLEQARLANQQLKRIQIFSSPIEISNGTALNVLLNDMRKRIGKLTKGGAEPITISADILHRINVYQNKGNLGLIRDDGKITWPVLFLGVLNKQEQDAVDVIVRNALLAAEQDKIDPQQLKKLRLTIEHMRGQLLEKINELPTMEYLDGKRFLNDLDEARLALENNEAPGFLKFQRFIAKGKTVQELADYMVNNGLKFAPATSRDEGSYRALHSAMAAFDLALNAQFPQGPPGPPGPPPE